MKIRVDTSEAPSTNSLLSQAIIANGFIFTGGFIHTTSDGKLVGDTVEEKVHQIMKNLKAVLNAAGADLDDVVKATVYVTDITDLPKLNEVYKTYFTEPLPAREGVCVKALPLGATCEISMIAVKKTSTVY